jgi:hypothetical protein
MVPRFGGEVLPEGNPIGGRLRFLILMQALAAQESTINSV